MPAHSHGDFVKAGLDGEGHRRSSAQPGAFNAIEFDAERRQPADELHRAKDGDPRQRHTLIIAPRR